MQELSWKTICGYFPKRNRNSHKGTFGTLLCITGSNRMPGACALSTLAALRSGAGLVKVATTEQNLPILASQIYEAVYLPMQTTETGEICWEKNAAVLQPDSGLLKVFCSCIIVRILCEPEHFRLYHTPVRKY